MTSATTETANEAGYGYAPHYCRNDGSWGADAQEKLDNAATVEELRAIWEPLAGEGKTDSFGGSEWHHAVAHLLYRHSFSAGA